jgi:hypothetical protein
MFCGIFIFGQFSPLSKTYLLVFRILMHWQTTLTESMPLNISAQTKRELLLKEKLIDPS